MLSLLSRKILTKQVYPVPSMVCHPKLLEGLSACELVINFLAKKAVCVLILFLQCKHYSLLVNKFSKILPVEKYFFCIDVLVNYLHFLAVGVHWVLAYEIECCYLSHTIDYSVYSVK